MVIYTYDDVYNMIHVYVGPQNYGPKIHHSKVFFERGWIEHMPKKSEVQAGSPIVFYLSLIPGTKMPFQNLHMATEMSGSSQRGDVKNFMF